MAYNKAKEEHRWKQWKEKEEKQLRLSGMDESSIQELRCRDWEDFKSDRRFKEHHIILPEQPDRGYLMMDNQEIDGIQALLDEVSDERLFNILIHADRETMQILFLKVIGFSTAEIAEKLATSEKSVYCRIERLKKKYKNFIKCEEK